MTPINSYNKLETQYKMSDKFAKIILIKLKENKMEFSKFCELLKVDEYFLKKVIDRKIQASCYMSLLEKIAKLINVSEIKLYK